ncbi:unnamed protein product, partial [Pylaiella littoralis]
EHRRQPDGGSHRSSRSHSGSSGRQPKRQVREVGVHSGVDRSSAGTVSSVVLPLEEGLDPTPSPCSVACFSFRTNANRRSRPYPAKFTECTHRTAFHSAVTPGSTARPLSVASRRTTPVVDPNISFHAAPAFLRPCANSAAASSGTQCPPFSTTPPCRRRITRSTTQPHRCSSCPGPAAVNVATPAAATAAAHCSRLYAATAAP